MAVVVAKVDGCRAMADGSDRQDYLPSTSKVPATERESFLPSLLLDDEWDLGCLCTSGLELSHHLHRTVVSDATWLKGCLGRIPDTLTLTVVMLASCLHLRWDGHFLEPSMEVATSVVLSSLGQVLDSLPFMASSKQEVGLVKGSCCHCTSAPSFIDTQLAGHQPDFRMPS